MRIAIYGGTFDPPHRGHIAVAHSVIEQKLADKTWLLVSPLNPLKDGQKISSEADRLAMAELSTRGIEGVEVSDFEFSLPRPSYSIATLRKLKDAYPEHEFRMLIGADNIKDFHRWKEPEAILTEFGLIVYPRPGATIGKEEIEANVSSNRGRIEILENVARYDISSTEIRQKIQQGEDISDIINPEVEKYIRAHHLYRQ
ncbi:MAG: nicotinate (nicotinamide) nucleotide adenylyltransferase [Clostridium sp.]|nr:nicotinate (nicotinamide) nucleotide adenylyltransferase [Prevotella sp.]MCM1428642.1 nicotinate (nicotinamide) nucleotide adenylyltransferase [Clostridium sp.]MCM1475771.1 nicotinate (nicotinamide) nucleotide adenylyltransferase [Muribaculaceae bacterium]